MSLELPILWVPGCVVLPGIDIQVVVRGRGRARALWNAEEETNGRLLVAPGAYAPRRTEDLPAILCEAQIALGGIPGGTQLRGIRRVHVKKVLRTGRNRHVEIEPIDDRWERHPVEGAAAVRAAWIQLEEIRRGELPRTAETMSADPPELVWRVASTLPATTDERLRILAEDDIHVRLELVARLLRAEVDLATLENQILGLG